MQQTGFIVLVENTRRLAAGMNPQAPKRVGGADSSTTKFAPMPRLIHRLLVAGIGRGQTLYKGIVFWGHFIEQIQ